MPKKLGECKCPIAVCGKTADVMEGEKGAAYIRCEHCATMIRSMTRGVRDWMRSLCKTGTPPAPPKDEKKDAPPPKKDTPPKGDDKAPPEKKRGALSFLGVK